MADSSFDVVSKVDKQEVSNALNQAEKEISQRYDFKGVGASIEWSGEKILIADDSDQIRIVNEPPEQLVSGDVKQLLDGQWKELKDGQSDHS